MEPVTRLIVRALEARQRIAGHGAEYASLPFDETRDAIVGELAEAQALNDALPLAIADLLARSPFPLRLRGYIEYLKPTNRIIHHIEPTDATLLGPPFEARRPLCGTADIAEMFVEKIDAHRACFACLALLEVSIATRRPK